MIIQKDLLLKLNDIIHRYQRSDEVGNGDFIGSLVPVLLNDQKGGKMKKEGNKGIAKTIEPEKK